MPLTRANASTKVVRSGPAPSMLKSAVTNYATRSHYVPAAPIATGIAPAKLLNHPQTEVTGDGTVLNLPDASKPFTAMSFNLGEIIKFPHLVPSLDSNAKEEERIKCDLMQGHICVKIRFAVVVAKYSQRMIVLPIYSCGKKGVQYKPEAYKAMVMAIWNPEDQAESTKKLLELTPDRLCTTGGRNFFAGSHINIADTVSVSYNWDIVPAQARLRKPDTEYLIKRFRLLQESGYKPPGQGGQFFARGVQIQRAEKRAEAGTSVPLSTVGPSIVGSTNAGSAAWRDIGAKGPGTTVSGVWRR